VIVLSDTATQSDPSIDEINAVIGSDSSSSDASSQDQNVMTTAFFNALPLDKQKAFKEKAPSILKAFVADDNNIFQFGSQTLEEVNSVVQKILDTQGKISIPEVDNLLVSANRELDNFQGKYKNQVSSFDKKKKKFLGLFGSAKRSVQDWVFEAKTTAHQFDVINGKIIDKREHLKKSFYMANDLLETNQKSTNGMVGIMAALEATHDEALEQAAILTEKVKSTPESTPEWNKYNQDLQRMADVSNSIEKLHASYMSRLAIAWATNTQVRNLMRISSETVAKLNDISNNTIPTMKLVVSQIGYIGELKDAAGAAESMKKASDHALDMWTKASEQTIPALEAQAQSSTIDADKVMALADSIVKQNEGVITAIENGRKNRVALEHAVLEAGDKIKKSDRIRDEKLVEVLLGEKQKNKDLVTDFEKEASASYTSATDLANNLPK
jgi:uncharacterized protein YaaN involved in tellurite resistance